MTAVLNVDVGAASPSPPCSFAAQRAGPPHPTLDICQQWRHRKLTTGDFYCGKDSGRRGREPLVALGSSAAQRAGPRLPTVLRLDETKTGFALSDVWLLQHLHNFWHQPAPVPDDFSFSVEHPGDLYYYGEDSGRRGREPLVALGSSAAQRAGPRLPTVARKK